ncbi:uncharacterized protein HMPREF1541_01918 [Cyphellophora europaea CBS 101466]|uniref:Amino acid permease n=1 Tax=Cyphellophora europaea (strain CBS 101466) TaxID=1220924 RepID=W2S2E3_CYPE1|nr:uncharacterized protein HMPREF1541_01918 [Cyphellophora europaea CBS 101466]ETN42760.1 hypothetical protein HMPREF1541_01918 [Cyphellophora europaea CBS 101466]
MAGNKLELKNRTVDTQEDKLDAPSSQRALSRSQQTLDRYINFIPTVAFPVTLQTSWEALSVSFGAGLLNGGPTALVWGLLLCLVGTLTIALSLAEMASITPVVGAQYRWTALYSPRGFGPPAFWSLLQGWITCFAWIAVCTQVCFLEGTIVQGLIILNNSTYIPQGWHGTLLAYAILAVPLFCNIFARRVLAPLEVLGGIVHIALFVVFVVVLVAMSPRSSAGFVFATSITDQSGYSQPGVSWCLGLLATAFPLGGFDGVIHMAAEVKNAPLRIPQAMVLTVLINGAMAWGIIVTILFCIGDPSEVSQTPYMYPIIQILLNSTGSKGATTAIMAFILFIGVVAVFSTLASVSRLTWAFARDGGLPFSPFFAKVHPTLRVPLNSLLLITAIVMLLNLINIGSTTAFFAILSLNTLSLYLSYIIPIVLFTIHKIRGFYVPYGPFKLPRGLGLPINIFAICYAVFIAVFLPWPSAVPVSAETMNYAGPVLGFVIMLSILDWMISGRKRFRVPVDVRQGDVDGSGDETQS